MSSAPDVDAELVRWAQPRETGGFPEEASRLLAALGTLLLSDPTDEVLTALRSCAEPPIPEPLGERLSEFAAAASATESLAARIEHTRLFHHPMGPVCPPWECVERDAEPQLMGPRHHEMLRWYRRAGVEPQLAGSESVDHVGLELTLLALLAARTAAGEDRSAMFAEFWSAHVATWMPAFAQRLIDTTRLELYRAAGRLLLAVTAGSVDTCGHRPQSQCLRTPHGLTA